MQISSLLPPFFSHPASPSEKMAREKEPSSDLPVATEEDPPFFLEKLEQTPLKAVFVRSMHLLPSLDSALPAWRYARIMRELNANLQWKEDEKATFFAFIFRATTHSESKGSLEAFWHWCKTAREILGPEILSFLHSTRRCEQLAQWTSLLPRFLSIEEEGASAFALLYSYAAEQIHWENLLEEISKLEAAVYMRKFPPKSVEEVAEGFSQQRVPLSVQAIDLLVREYNIIEEKSKQWANESIDELHKRAQQVLTSVHTQDGRTSLFAIARLVMRIQYGLYPFNTQLFALLGLLHHPSNIKGRIAQIKTSEGKSLIVALLALHLAAGGKKVDIISSSRYLSERDQYKWAPFFHFFGFTTQHICLHEPKKSHFSPPILYGTNSDFEFSILRDALYRKGTRNQRPCDAVIVDEADNFFLDASLQSARLACPSIKSNNWIFQPMLEFIQRAAPSSPQLLPLLLPSLKQCLAKTENGGFASYIATISEKQWMTWLQSAYTALYQKQINVDYVLRSGKKKQSIVIVDKTNTGRLQKKSRWQSGLHEFLEAKHHLSPENDQGTIASICHPVFFDSYSSIYGVTGTMGSEVERKEVQTLFGVDTFDVPPHQATQRTLFSPLLCVCPEEQQDAIVNEIRQMQLAKRPILLLCETIQASDELSCFLQKKAIRHQLLNDTQSQAEECVVAKAGMPTSVTVATHVAGRGTDIILHFLALEKGGLHVVFTFYPENERAEQQGIGRGARMGQPGSFRFILITEKSIQQLSLEREEKIQALSAYRIQRSKVERIHHYYLEQFFDFLKQCDDGFFSTAQHNREKCLEKIRQHWAEQFYTPIQTLYQEMEAEHALFSLQDYHAILQQWYQKIKTELTAIQEEVKNEP